MIAASSARDKGLELLALALLRDGWAPAPPAIHALAKPFVKAPNVPDAEVRWRVNAPLGAMKEEG
jgi:hypothetical protein